MKSYRGGTHRAVPPEVTLARITPLLPRFGITRLADVTGLDRLGIPTYCAIRPTAKSVQVSNGKGLRRVDAQVSALMEAIELAVSEEPPAPLVVRASPAELQSEGRRFNLDVPLELRRDGPAAGRIEWVQGTELMGGEALLLPAAVPWLRARQVVQFSSNGLASGNTLVEATLHALYEILERHVLAGLFDGSRLEFSRASVLAPADAPADSVRSLDERIAAAGVRLVLLRANTPLALHSFMAVILDRDPFASVTAVNLGYGAHLSPIVAATRAITEAAQARLTFIHGSREDLRKDQYQRSAAQARVVAVIGKLEPNAGWEELTDWSTDQLETDLQAVLATMRGHGLARAYCVDMSPPEMPFAVAKVWAPEARNMK